MKKNNMKSICVLSAFIGMILYNIMGNYYGLSGQKLVIYVSTSIFIIGLLGLVLMKHFLVALLLFMMGLPVVVMAIGMYLDNLMVVVGGIILLIIMLPIVIKITPYLAKYKK